MARSAAHQAIRSARVLREHPYEVADNGVGTVTLDDPDTRNALGSETLDELLAAFAAARADDGVRCAVLACDLVIASADAGFGTRPRSTSACFRS